MDLYIDTTRGHDVSLALKNGGKVLRSTTFTAKYKQAEKLLPGIEFLLKQAGAALSDLKKIVVAGRGGGFSSLRIGVATANALAYAMDIPAVDMRGKNIKAGAGDGVSIVVPKYNKSPNITKSNRKLS